MDSFGAQLEQDMFREIMTISDVNTPQDVLDMVERIIRLLEEQTQANGDMPDEESGEAQSQKPDGGQDDASGNAQGQGQADTQDNVDNQAQDKNQGDTSTEEPSDNAEPQSTDNSDLQTTADNPQPESPDNNQSVKNASGQATPQTRIQQALDSDEEIGDFGEQLRELAREKEASGQDQSFDIAAAADKADLLATGYKQQSITAHSGLVARLSSRLRGLLQAQNLQKRHASIHRQPHSQKPPAPHKNRRSKAVSPQGAEKNRKHGHSPARGQLHVHGRERTIPYDKGSHAGPG